MVKKRKVKPLDKIEVFGKNGGTDKPFSVRGHRGFYFYIPAETFRDLNNVNNAYKSVYKTGIRPLENIKIVGRGGIDGYRPFLLKGQEGMYLCILAEHLRQLEKINSAYRKVSGVEEKRVGKKKLEVKKRVLERERKKREAERKKGLEEERRLEKERKKKLEEKRKLERERKRHEAELKKRLEEERKKELEKKKRKREDELKKKIEKKKRPEEEKKRKLEKARKKKRLEGEKKRKLERERKKRLEKERKKKIEAGKKKLELKRKKAKEALTGLINVIEEAKEAKGLKYVPEVMQQVEKSFAEINKAIKAAKYDKAIKLIPRSLELAIYAKSEALRKAKLKVPEGKYLYGIIPAPEKEKSFGNIGIGSKGRVYTINYKDVSAIVSDTEVKEYSVTEEYSKAHENVVRTVLKKHSVVPAAFGQVFKNQKILRVLMKKAYKMLNESMKLVDNKVELGVKAILSKEIGESLDEKKKRQFERSASEIYSRLNKNADESVKGRLFSNRLILNSSFLVDKRKIKGFSKDVEMLSNKHRDMKLRYSGPWPPYSFVYIRIGAKGIETGKREVR